MTVITMKNRTYLYRVYSLGISTQASSNPADLTHLPSSPAFSTESSNA